MAFHFNSPPIPRDVSAADWHSWQWQFRQALTGLEDLKAWFNLNENEEAVFRNKQLPFKVQIPPFYTALAQSSPQDPIRRMVLPTTEELETGRQSVVDPLGERRHSPHSRVVHRYPDRVLFLITDTCGIYCRYCLRKHFTGQDEAFINSADYEKAISYIRANDGIKEVILSGGDPLTVSDARLLKVVADLRAISHIEIIRIGTRMPVAAPMRLTDSLIGQLKKYHPVYFMVHINHPQEISLEATEVLQKLVNNGFPVFNQMVLLRGINNHPAIVQALSRRLLYLRVKPYYMFQCDPSQGSDHFRISIEESLAIQRELWGKISGLAMPNLSLDIPGGGGKVGLVPDMALETSAQAWRFRGWDGQVGEYLNPAPTIQKPFISEEYLAEWEKTCSQSYGSK